MLLFVLGFLAGDLYLQTFAHLPSNYILYSLLILVIIITTLGRHHWCILCFPLAGILGFVFTAWYATYTMSWTLPKAQENKPQWIIGTIASLPQSNRFGVRFEFVLQSNKTRIRLTWRHADKNLRVGDTRRLLVKLKRIHSIQSPGAFDFEAWAFEKGLRATGAVINHPNNQLLGHAWYRYPINQIRARLQQKIQAILPHSPTAPWLLALMLGERADIATDAWQVLRNTGTNHLMAIAGLHIGLMSGLIYKITVFIWRFIPTAVLMLPAPAAGACGALLLALIYSALAGFALPTERACIMLSVFILTQLLRRKTHTWRAWSIALWIVLLLNPLSVLSESFWLSFGTIALIIYGMDGRLAPNRLWWHWGRAQWVIGIGLIPLTWVLFQQCSVISFFANSIAIPWLGLLILPFCLLSLVSLSFSTTLSGFFLWIADRSLAGLWLVLSWFANSHLAVWQQVIPNGGLLLLSMLSFLWLLLPVGVPSRWLAFLWLAPVIFHQPLKPAWGHMWLTLLDVGQGLAVVVQTKQHTLVYDTGPSYQDSINMGDSVLLPYLHKVEIKQIDSLVISHGDNDHIGGANTLLAALPVNSIYTSVPNQILTPMTNLCLQGMSWQWDGVQFAFIHPSSDYIALRNDSSCVLRIDNGVERILIPGDSEKKAEKSLLQLTPTALANMTLLIAPHHGSKTSALPEFVERVHPRYVLYATGYHNRYHFPHKSVIAVYQQLQAQTFNTAEVGTIRMQFSKNQRPKIELYRQNHQRYWLD